jgi:outer membrane protein OmpA-like peptidoglycan-associated protein
MHARGLISVFAVSLAVGGCATQGMTETQRDTARGAGIGAAAGAVLGAVISHDKPAKGAAIGAAVGAAAGGIGGNIWSQRMQEQRRAMEEASRGTGVEVSQTADNELKLEIPADISFDTGKAEIRPDMRPVLDRFAQTLGANPVTEVRIVGHTDSTGGDQINIPLSRERTRSAKAYLVDRGVAESRIAVEGRGASQPIADNATADGRARNRRIEIFVAEAAGNAY